VLLTTQIGVWSISRLNPANSLLQRGMIALRRNLLNENAVKGKQMEIYLENVLMLLPRN